MYLRPQKVQGLRLESTEGVETDSEKRIGFLITPEARLLGLP